jgi:hypothetical protein
MNPENDWSEPGDEAPSGGRSSKASPADLSRSWVGSTLRAALVVVGAVGIAGWMVLALVHVDDRYRIGHVQGHWMALAQYVNDGTLYPPLSDGERFGGTRHMPLPILVNALAARITGEYLVSGKAVAMVLFVALLILLLVTLRHFRCPWPFAVALTGLLPATTTGVLVGSTPGGDVLPVVLQVATLLLVSAALRHETLGWLVLAGGLAGLAAAAKLTGVWAALAVVSWLGLRREWRRLGWFAAAGASTAALTFGAVQWASEGRFLSTLLALTFAGGSGSVGWARAPSQLAYFGSGDAPAVWMVAPFAMVGVLAAWRASAISLYHHALAWCVAIVLVVFTDVGAGLNQLLDPGVLTILAVGHLAARLGPGRLDRPTLATALAVTIAWAGATGIRGLVPDLRVAASALRTGQTPPQYDPQSVARVAAPNATLLAEDPGLPVLLGRTPVVLDPFMLRRLDEVMPRAVDVLVARIERREFDRVALVIPLDEDDAWWRDYHFGPRVAGALEANYVFVGRVDRYSLYEPGVP